MAVDNGAAVFTPILIRYEGLDASRDQIDLNLLGQSLQGAARLIAVAGHIATRREYVSRMPAMAVRILAEPPQAHCFELMAHIHWATAVLPLFHPATGKIVEAIVTYFIKKFGSSPTEASKALDVALAAVTATEANASKALDVASKALDTVAAGTEAMRQILLTAANDQRPAVRSFAAPVGLTANTAVIGDDPEIAFPIDGNVRQLIDATPKAHLGPTREFAVFISELDTETGHGKVAIRGENEEEKRFPCKIVDPAVFEAGSAYSSALDQQNWISVRAKPHLDDKGEIERLTISDTGS